MPSGLRFVLALVHTLCAAGRAGPFSPLQPHRSYDPGQAVCACVCHKAFFFSKRAAGRLDMKKPQSASIAKRKRNEPLEAQMLKDRVALFKVRRGKRPGQKKAEGGGKGESESEEQSDNDAVDTLDAKQTSRILREAKQQQLELEEEARADSADNEPWEAELPVEGLSESEGESDDASDHAHDEAELATSMEASELEKMNPHDRQLFEQWSQPAMGTASRSLSEMILEKLGAKATLSDAPSPGDAGAGPSLNSKVALVYQKLGVLLNRYKSGKLPKAFKVLPALRNWEQVLLLTQPAEWSPHAVYQATRLFSSSLKPWQAQRYYTAVLLPHVRESMAREGGESNKRHCLSPHLYDALRKSIYKPSAFFKGILLPLAESGDCTLKEAAILSSVMAKTSIPVLHASAALLKLAEMPYSGASSLFIRTLLDKKFTLPYRVVDELVLHFSRFKKEERELTVLWHQSLLVFCQRYKEELTSEQKQAISTLVQAKHHQMISPEIARELHSTAHSSHREAAVMQDA